MARILCATLFVCLLTAACRDEPRAPDNPVGPTVSLGVEEAPLDTSSSVCRAYVREYAAVRAAKDSGVFDVQSRQRSAALSVVIDDACR